MFKDGIAAAVNLLSTRTPASNGHCSASVLAPSAGPTMAARLYIAAMPEGEGGFADGVRAAIGVLAKYKPSRGPGGAWALVETDLPSVDMQLYIAELQAIVEFQSL